MDKDTYLKTRVDDQMAWFDKKSGWNQRRYKVIKGTEIILAVIIPFLAGLSGSGFQWTSIAIGILGVVIAAAEGIQGLYKFNEKWIEYRMTREALLHEKMLFLTSSDLYAENPETAFKTFVERVENILAQETNRWKDYTRVQNTSQKNDDSPE